MTNDQNELLDRIEKGFAEISKTISEIKTSVEKLGIILHGECPSCGRTVKGWQSPSGSFAPEARATLREKGINPATGHLLSCDLARQEKR